VKAHLFIEGGESKEDQIRCRESFRRLLEKSGFSLRMPRLWACGSRNATYKDFQTAHKQRRNGEFIGMLVDSEDPVQDCEKTWRHLFIRDGWYPPVGANDEQVFLMATCMETWIVADRLALEIHFGQNIQMNALPPLVDLEVRHRHDVLKSLLHATRNCSSNYSKGKTSFILVGLLDPATLNSLPSFSRMIRILKRAL